MTSPTKRSILFPLVALLLIGGGCAKTPTTAVRDASAPVPAPPKETGNVVEHSLVAKKTTVELKPGLSTEAWAYNETVPGPEIRATLGDRVKITFKNELDEPSTIHWHGIRVPAAMDGVPMVSQEPVPPGGTFTYEFLPPDAGTYFYHSHVRVDEQVDRGLYGAFVVEPSEKATMRDGVFALDDWLLDAKGARLPTTASEPELAIDNVLDVVSEAATASRGHAGHMMADGSMMMGGMGSGGMMNHMIPAEINGRFGNVVTVNGRANGFVAPIVLARGERFLARFLNASNAMTHELKSSDGRAFAVVAVDGIALSAPYVTDRLILPPAKRFDVVLEATNGKDWALAGGTGKRAIRIPIKIEGETETVAMPSSGVAPAMPDLRAAKPDATFQVETDSMMNATSWVVNGRPYDMEGENPVLATFARGTWVKMRFENASPMAHTMHVHGHFMRVITRNGQRVDANTSEDTVVMRPMETMDVVMLADNPGDWVMHCHNLDHEEHGLMANFKVE